MKDWVAWHEAYEDPSSSLSARLRRVRFHLSQAHRPGHRPARSGWSACAPGKATTSTGVLPGHPRS